MRNASRFIPGEEIEAVSQWSFGAVDTTALEAIERARAQSDTVALARDEGVRQQAYAEGFAQGRARATVDAEHRMAQYMQQQGHESAQRLASLFATAQEQIAQSQQAMAQGVLELACEMARQLLRHELSVNPNALQPVIREALDVLALQAKGATVHLNPIDMEVLRDSLQAEFLGLSLQLLADPAVKPGGCLVASAGTVVDGTLESRWRRVLANLGLRIEWED